MCLMSVTVTVTVTVACQQVLSCTNVLDVEFIGKYVVKLCANGII